MVQMGSGGTDIVGIARNQRDQALPAAGQHAVHGLREFRPGARSNSAGPASFVDQREPGRLRGERPDHIGVVIPLLEIVIPGDRPVICPAVDQLPNAGAFGKGNFGIDVGIGARAHGIVGFDAQPQEPAGRCLDVVAPRHKGVSLGVWPGRKEEIGQQRQILEAVYPADLPFALALDAVPECRLPRSHSRHCGFQILHPFRAGADRQILAAGEQHIGIGRADRAALGMHDDLALGLPEMVAIEARQEVALRIEQAAIAGLHPAHPDGVHGDAGRIEIEQRTVLALIDTEGDARRRRAGAEGFAHRQVLQWRQARAERTEPSIEGPPPYQAARQ